VGAGLDGFAGGFAVSFCLPSTAGGLADGACDICGFPGTPFAEGATGAGCGTGAAPVAAASAFGLPPRFLGPCSGPGPPAASLFPRRPRRGGGGGGGGSGGEYGVKNLTISLCDRSLPSMSRRKASSRIFLYSGCSGVMRISGISGNGSFWRNCGHLLRKFLSFWRTAAGREVIAVNNTVSGRLCIRNFQVAEGCPRSLAIKRLAKSLASSSTLRQRSTNPLLGSCRWIAE